MTPGTINDLIAGGTVFSCIGLVTGMIRQLQVRWIRHLEEPGECIHKDHQHRKVGTCQYHRAADARD